MLVILVVIKCLVVDFDFSVEFNMDNDAYRRRTPNACFRARRAYHSIKPLMQFVVCHFGLILQRHFFSCRVKTNIFEAAVSTFLFNRC